MSQHAQITSGSELPEQENLFRRSFWLGWVILGLPVLYVLSLGPAIYVFPVSVIRPVYGPLIMFEEHCPPLERFQTWYLEKVWGCKMW